MISTLMIITSMAMLAFPKQLRGNRIPAPHEQIDSIDAHKSTAKVEQQQQQHHQQLDDEAPPRLKGISINSIFISPSISIVNRNFFCSCDRFSKDH